MSISSISSPVPVQPAYPTTTQQLTPPNPNNDTDSDDAGAAQPVQATLPPGQGTQINQLV